MMCWSSPTNHPYPYRNFPRKKDTPSPPISDRTGWYLQQGWIAPVGLSVLGRTCGTYLHYERSYSINIFLFGGSGSRGSGLTCGQKRQIPGKFPRDSGIFPRKFTWENDITSLPFRCSGCDDDGTHCYYGPPRCPDEVLDPLRRPEACGIKGSFSTSLHADK